MMNYIFLAAEKRMAIESLISIKAKKEYLGSVSLINELLSMKARKKYLRSVSLSNDGMAFNDEGKKTPPRKNERQLNSANVNYRTKQYYPSQFQDFQGTLAFACHNQSLHQKLNVHKCCLVSPSFPGQILPAYFDQILKSVFVPRSHNFSLVLQRRLHEGEIVLATG